MPDERRHRLIALAIVALVPTILFADVLFGVASFYIRDVSLYHYPHQKMLREIVLGGEFPYWNPSISAGQPAAANPAYQTFYPLTWLILLPDYHTGFHLLALIHLYIAAFGMYALLRSMELGRPASVFGAVSFSAGGLLLSLLNVFPFLFSTAWLPLTCLFTRRFLLHRRPRDFAFASLGLGLQLLVGEPVTALQTGLVLGLYAIYRAVRDGGWKTAPKALAAIALISVAALLLSAVQTLPAIDHLGDSARGRGMAYKDVREWSTPPFRFAEVAYPNVMGRFDVGGTLVFWGARLYPERRTAFFYSIYCGLAVAALCLAGVFAGVRGRGLFVTVALLSALIASGDRTPLLRLLYDTGVGALARFPEKFVIMGVFAMVLFSAHTLDRLLAGEERVRRTAVAVTLSVALFAFLCAALSPTQPYDSFYRSLFSIPADRQIAPMFALLRREWLLAGLRGLLLFLLFRNAAGPRRRAWLGLFGLFVLIDLATQAPQIAPRISPAYYREAPPSVRHFRPERKEYRLFHVADWDTHDNVARRYFGTREPYLWVLRNALPPMLPATYGLRTVIDSDFDVTDLQAERDFSVAMWDLSRGGSREWLDIAAAMSNAWYVGVYRKRDQALAMAGGWNRNVEPVKFVEGQHYPRYYFANQLVTVRDRDEFVRALLERRFSRQVAFIHEPAFVPAPGIVRAKEERSAGARLDVEAAGLAFLVMSVTPHKYWTITIDGAEVPSLVTNIGYQGVVVPPGRHVVEMRYRNPLIAAGAAISMATLLGLAFGVWRTRFRVGMRDAE